MGHKQERASSAHMLQPRLSPSSPFELDMPNGSKSRAGLLAAVALKQSAAMFLSPGSATRRPPVENQRTPYAAGAGGTPRTLCWPPACADEWTFMVLPILSPNVSGQFARHQNDKESVVNKMLLKGLSIAVTAAAIVAFSYGTSAQDKTALAAAACLITDPAEARSRQRNVHQWQGWQTSWPIPWNPAAFWQWRLAFSPRKG